MSKRTLQATMDLLLDVFETPPDDFDYPPKWLPAALEPEKHKKLLKDFGNNYYKVWVALDGGKVIGVTGLYATKWDIEEAYWLAWFAVSKKDRGKGVGRKLLEFCIDKAKRDGKKYLRLYTSDGDVEKDAQRLYEKHGFRIVDGKKFGEIYDVFEKIGETKGEKRIFREKRI